MFGGLLRTLYTLCIMKFINIDQEMKTFLSASQARFSHARFSMDLADLLLWPKLAGGDPREDLTVGQVDLIKYKSIK